MMKNLVLSVGGTSDPLVKSIEDIKPNKVIFIASSETRSDIIKEVTELTSDLKPKYKHQIVHLENSEDLHKSFRAGYEARKFLEDGEIYVDYTGGTKSMSVGLALSFFGKDIKEYLYVGGSQREKKGVGAVKPGYERLIQKIDPAQLYCFNIAKRVEQLFNIGQYKLICNLLDHEISDSSHNEHLSELASIKNLTYTLQLWDSMDYRRSYAELKKYQKETKVFKLFQVNISNNFEEHLKKCQSDNNSNDRISDLYHAAQRRKEHGEYDEAVLRIYRAIEYIGQVAFQKKFDCETSDVLVEKLKNFTVYEKLKRKPKPVRLSFNETYEILNEASVKEGQTYIKYKNKFKNFNNMRHESVLAHGFKPCQERDVENRLKLIRLLRKNISKVDHPSIRFLF